MTSLWWMTHVNMEWNSQDFGNCWLYVTASIPAVWGSDCFQKKVKVNFLLMQLTDRLRLHCNYLSWTFLILHLFLKFILCICCSCAVDMCCCTCKLCRITDVMFAKQRLFSPELYLILDSGVQVFDAPLDEQFCAPTNTVQHPRTPLWENQVLQVLTTSKVVSNRCRCHSACTVSCAGSL